MVKLVKVQLVLYVQDVRIVQKEFSTLAEMMTAMESGAYEDCRIEFQLTPLGSGLVGAIAGWIASKFF